MVSDMDTTKDDGAACVICGEDAVWSPDIRKGTLLIPTPLCGSCSDDHTCLCSGCDHRILQSDGTRVFGSGLHCRSCATAWIGADVEQASRADVDRDDDMRRG